MEIIFNPIGYLIVLFAALIYNEIDTQDNTLKTILKQDMSREEEEIKRAEYIRKELK